MGDVKTWKKIKITSSSSKQSPLNYFLKEEISESRTVITEILDKKEKIDFNYLRPNLTNILKRKLIAPLYNSSINT